MTIRFDSDAGGQHSATVAAIFATERDAQAAIRNAHRAGFRQTWLSKTREPDKTTGVPTVEPDDVIARFLSAGTERRPLHAALIAHGLTEQQARRIEAEIAPGCYVVTAYGEDNPLFLAQLLADENGHVIDAAGMLPQAVKLAQRDGGTNATTVPTQRDEFRTDDGTYRDADGYEIEEFISTKRPEDL